MCMVKVCDRGCDVYGEGECDRGCDVYGEGV